MRRSAPPLRSFGQSHRALLGAAGVLIPAAALVYANSLRVPFFFDDPAAILDNPTIRNLGDLGSVLSPPKSGSGVSARPVVNLSLAINYALGGTNPVGYHVANLLFHSLAGLLLFGCVRRTVLLSPVTSRLRPHALALGFFAAALWLLHPLQTESVTCVIQRTEVLVGLFYLATLYAFIRAAESGSRGWAAVAVVSCFLGMASKEVMVTAPVIVLLFDRTFLAGSFAAAWQRRRSLYLGLATGWLLLAIQLAAVGGTRGQAAGFGVGVTWWSYALKQCEAIVLYAKLTLWPHPLVVFYGIDVVRNPLEVWPQLLLIVAAVVGTVMALRVRPVVGFFAAWFLVILSPSSSVVPLVTQTVSEHRMYLPLAAPLVAGAAWLFLRWPARAAAALTATVLALGVVSARRNEDYRSELAIWHDTVVKAPQNARAHINLGAVLKSAGRSDLALAEYKRANELDPSSAEALNNIGTIMIEAGRPADAIGPCEAALRINPNFALAHNNLGSALLSSGRIKEGVTHLETALGLRPDLAEAHSNLAGALLDLNQPAAAMAHAQDAVALRPTMPHGHFNLARAWLAQKDVARARAEFEATLQADPNYANAHRYLGGLLYQAGDPAGAVPHFRAALANQPEDYNNLASALTQIGRFDEAVEQYRTALRLKPDYVEGHLNLALVLTRAGRTAEAISAYQDALRLKPNDPRATQALAQLRGAAPAP